MSLFQNLYKYKQSEKRNSKENFLTEIFAYCLEKDEKFKTAFLVKIGIKEKVSLFEINTQVSDEESGKPDISIRLNKDTYILIECKVDSQQGEGQLERYSKILHKDKSSKKYLVFLTKLFESTADFPDIQFKAIRWHEIFDLIKSPDNIITQELYHYLVKEKMSTKITFHKSELNAIRSYNETISKMDEFLERMKVTVMEHTKLKPRNSKRLEKHYDYGISTDFMGGNLWIGFYQYDKHDEMQLCISIEKMPNKTAKNKRITEYVKSKKWDFIGNNYWKSKGLSAFFNGDEFDSKKAYNFIEKALLEIVQP